MATCAPSRRQCMETHAAGLLVHRNFPVAGGMQSGFKGMTGHTDLRAVSAAAASGDAAAQLAIEVCHTATCRHSCVSIVQRHLCS